MPNLQQQSALVLFSGGQDSTTCLSWALQTFATVFAITFDYGQRHNTEITQAKAICELLGIEQTILKTDLFSRLTESALLNTNDEIKETETLPTSFVPGRNLIFLSLAAIHAKKLRIDHLVTGVCQTDYSGYPDCRDEFVRSLEKTVNLAMQTSITIHTPLMFLTKANTVKMIKELGHLELLRHSHTCYEGLRPACGKCPACALRQKGFREAGEKDPLEYQPF